jgi:transcriptional regulator with XRE-family HTH domain
MMEQGFGDFIRQTREARGLPLRKVAAHLDIDTSTLSKVERGERPASTEYLKPLADILGIDLRSIQVTFISDRILGEFGELEHVIEGVKEAEKQIKRMRK